MSRRNRKKSRTQSVDSPSIPDKKATHPIPNHAEPNIYCAKCGKKNYGFEFEAQSAAHHQMSLNSSIQIKIYRCPHNMGFHLSSRRD